MDVERAAELYTQGWTLRQIGAELGVHWSTVSQQLRSAGIRMRSGGPQAHPTSTDQIAKLRNQGLTWNEIAEQVDMTVFRCLEPLSESSATEATTIRTLAASAYRRA